MAGLRIAYLVPLISSELSTQIWRGVYQRAKELDCTITIVAGRLPQDCDAGPSPANHVYYDLDPAEFDGLILYAGSLTWFGQIDTYRRFLDRLPPLPRVHIGLEIPHEYSVLVDNRSSMQAMTRHLLQDHQISRLAWIGGPPDNADARDRLAGFHDALAEAGIVADPDWEVEGEYTIDSGIQGVRDFLDRRRLKPEAIVCVDDETAIGAYKALQDHGIAIPGDILVSGFDNAPSAGFLKPGLTTVHQDFDSLGISAVDTLHALCRHEAVQQATLIPARLVIRHSCSCRNPLFDESSPQQPAVPVFSQEHLSRILQTLGGCIKSRVSESLYLLIEELAPSLQFLHHGLEEHLLALREIQHRFVASQAINADSTAFLDRVILLGSLSLSKVWARMARAEANSANFRMSEMDYIINNLHQCHDRESFFDSFAEGLENLNIAALSMILSDGVHCWTSGNLPPDSCITVREPLFFGDTDFGTAILSCLPDWVANCDSVAIHMGATLYRLKLLEESQSQARELGRMLENLHLTQDRLVQREKQAALGRLVAGLAHELNTPVGNGLTSISFQSSLLDDIEQAFLQGTITRRQMLQFIERSKSATTAIWQSLERAGTLIENFKAIAVDEDSETLRPIDLKPVLQLIIDSLKPRIAGRELDLYLHCPDSVWIKGNAGALLQIFTRLINNSSEHGYPDGQGGIITIGVRISDQGNDVCIDYRDDGIGIAPDIRASIFDPFNSSQRAMGHLGLGMHMVFQLCSRTLGGSIRLQESDRGTHFLLQFPLCSESCQESGT